MKKDNQKTEEKILFFDDSVYTAKEPLPVTDPKIRAIMDKYINEAKKK